MKLVFDFLENEVNLQRNDSIVVGVSAGPDSMFLLYILIELQKKIGFNIIVAHINHNIRQESVSEEQFLKQYCKDQGRSHSIHHRVILCLFDFIYKFG